MIIIYFYVQKIAHFSFAYEKANKTDSLQPSGCNGLLVSLMILVLSVGNVEFP